MNAQTNTQVTLPAVVRSVTVNAPVERAFAVFTESFAQWWPPAHHINPAGYAGAYIEPALGGRWYERAEDGTECDWGRVLEWQPPHKLRLSWHLNGEFAYDPDPAHASEVEVSFVAEGPTRTRVELAHRHFERAIGGERLHRGVSQPHGWGQVVQRFADLLEGRELTPVD
jgi:uncharacterized protein YndB with AHSA1/START domain